MRCVNFFKGLGCTGSTINPLPPLHGGTSIFVSNCKGRGQVWSIPQFKTDKVDCLISETSRALDAHSIHLIFLLNLKRNARAPAHTILLLCCIQPCSWHHLTRLDSCWQARPHARVGAESEGHSARHSALHSARRPAAGRATWRLPLGTPRRRAGAAASRGCRRHMDGYGIGWLPRGGGALLPSPWPRLAADIMGLRLLSGIICTLLW